MITMKVLFQRLWELKLGWDEELPDDLSSTSSLEEPTALASRQTFQPLLLQVRLGEEVVQLHGFPDASETVYSAVVYVRATFEEGPPTVVLVAAKTKVAPLKRLSIPRLELCVMLEVGGKLALYPYL